MHNAAIDVNGCNVIDSVPTWTFRCSAERWSSSALAVNNAFEPIPLLGLRLQRAQKHDDSQGVRTYRQLANRVGMA